MIRIITDSISDIAKELQEKWRINLMSLEVRFGEKLYKDGIDLSAAEFYQKLSTSKELPQTAQVNPHEFAQVFEKYIAASDDIVCILASSHLSGTYQSAVIAKNMACSEKIHVVDTLNATAGEALLVQEAVKLRDEGLSVSQIADAITALTGRVRLLLVLDTLHYLKMGGRISATSAAFASVLGINPIITLAEGKVEAAGKARGKSKAFKWILDRMEQDAPDFERPLAFMHSNAPETLKDCMNILSTHIKAKDVSIYDIGSTVGTHAGPGAVGIAYFTQA